MLEIGYVEERGEERHFEIEMGRLGRCQQSIGIEGFKVK